MKDFLKNLDTTDTFVLILFILIAIVTVSVVLIVSITQSIDLYLLRDNVQAIALYLEGK